MKTINLRVYTSRPVKLRGVSIERQVDHRVVECETRVYVRGTSGVLLRLPEGNGRAMVSPPLPHMEAMILTRRLNGSKRPCVDTVTESINAHTSDAASAEDHGFPVIY